MRRLDAVPTLWCPLRGQVPFEKVMSTMDTVERALQAGTTREQVWTCENSPGYSRGRNAEEGDVVGRGALKVDGGARFSHIGSYWYHGPGHLTVITLLDLRKRRKSVSDFSALVHQWVADSLQKLGADVAPRADKPGVWAGEKKVAAVVLRLSQWVSSYGVGINVDPDMDAVAKVRPCGRDACTVTSLRQLKAKATIADVDAALRTQFHETFGWTSDGPTTLEEII